MVQRDYNKAWMLRVILVYADQALFDEVSAETKPTDRILSDVAYNADLACKTDKFLYLLGRITDKEDQEEAVRNGVVALFDANKPEYLDPLLFALQNEPSLGPRLDECCNPVKLSGRPLSSPMTEPPMPNASLTTQRSLQRTTLLLYVIHTDSEDPKNELFHWLLTRADGQDLEKARSDKEFSICLLSSKKP